MQEDGKLKRMLGMCAHSLLAELFMTKYNQNETLNEMYGSQMWLPIRNIDGEFGALFNGIIETTKQVVGERRNLLLKTVAEMTGEWPARMSRRAATNLASERAQR